MIHISQKRPPPPAGVFQIALFKGFPNIPRVPPPPPYGTHSGRKSGNADDGHRKPTELAHSVPTPRDLLISKLSGMLNFQRLRSLLIHDMMKPAPQTPCCARELCGLGDVTLGEGGGGGAQRGRLRAACGQRRVESKNSQRTLTTTSTSSIRQLLGAADAQTAHHATFSTAPTHQLLGSANTETTPAGAPAAAADRKQQPDATCERKNG